MSRKIDPVLGFLRVPPPPRGGVPCQTCAHKDVKKINTASLAFAAAKARADEKNEPGHKRSWPQFLEAVIRGTKKQPGVAPTYPYKHQAYVRHLRNCLDIDA